MDDGAGMARMGLQKADWVSSPLVFLHELVQSAWGSIRDSGPILPLRPETMTPPPWASVFSPVKWCWCRGVSHQV